MITQLLYWHPLTCFLSKDINLLVEFLRNQFLSLFLKFCCFFFLVLNFLFLYQFLYFYYFFFNSFYFCSFSYFFFFSSSFCFCYCNFLCFGLHCFLYSSSVICKSTCPETTFPWWSHLQNIQAHLSCNTSYGSAANLQVFHLPRRRYFYSTWSSMMELPLSVSQH